MSINIYVGNLSSTVTEDQLRKLFSEHGEVTAVKIIKDKFTGEARGFAFVDMADNAAGQAAIEKTNGMELDGKRLRVNEARPREDNRGGGGGGFGGDRGPRRPYNGGGNGGGGNRGGGFGDRGPRY